MLCSIIQWKDKKVYTVKAPHINSTQGFMRGMGFYSTMALTPPLTGF